MIAMNWAKVGVVEADGAIVLFSFILSPLSQDRFCGHKAGDRPHRLIFVERMVGVAIALFTWKVLLRGRSVVRSQGNCERVLQL
jgi:hypothetical protein